MNVCWPVPVVIVLSTVPEGGEEWCRVAGRAEGAGPTERWLLSVMAAASRASSLSL